MTRRLSLRWRLGLLSVGVAGVMLAVALAVVLSSVEAALLHAATSRLEVEAGLLASDSGPGRRPPRATELAAGELAAVLGGNGTAVSILDPAGVVLAQEPNGASSEVRDLRLDPGAYAAVVSRGEALTRTVALEAGGRALVVAAPVQLRTTGPGNGNGNGNGNANGVGRGLGNAGGGRAPAADQANAVTQLAISLEPIDRALADLRGQIVIAGALVMLAGLLATWLLTGPALRPLTRVTSAAERIAAGDLAARAGLPDGDDEVGRLGRAFDAMAERVDATLRAQRSFAADASHELRSPLTVLGGYVDVLARGDADARAQAPILAAMRREIDRLSGLSGDLLLLTQLEAGGLRLEPRGVDLGDLLEDIGTAAAAAAPDRRIEVSRNGPLPVVADPDRLTQALMNLVDNAVRHSPTGSAVRLDARREDGHAIAAVANAGEPIPPDELPRLFDRFYRGRSQRAAMDGPHAGLGLPIVKAIVEASGGTVVAESDAAGTRFSIRLPVAHLGGP